jgi:hypothetical protein
VKLLSLADMNERLGFGPGYGLLWTASVTDILGVPPTKQKGSGTYWTEAQFIEIANRLRDRLTRVIDNNEDDL